MRKSFLPTETCDHKIRGHLNFVRYFLLNLEKDFCSRSNRALLSIVSLELPVYLWLLLGLFLRARERITKEIHSKSREGLYFIIPLSKIKNR